MSVFNEPMVFVDIETTGIGFQRHRVIEIACIRVENNKITDSFTSFVDPQMPLPPFITNLTGITESDLSGAPTFYDIAERLISLMDGAIFVAHNVRFDYGFLRREFKDCGYVFNPKLLCTVKLSRALYPEAQSHKLQDVIERCRLKVDTRHRAHDDAQALWQFIQHVTTSFPAPAIMSAVAQQIKSPSLPRNLPAGITDDLPEMPGVYIFEDEHGKPLYIGKSVNIRKRVLSHFSADHSFETEFKISQQIANIDTVITSGELQALLLESQLIKQRQPLYNRRLRRTQKLTLARQAVNEKGFITIGFEDKDRLEPAELSDVLGVYTSKGKAREYINHAAKTYGLCPKLMGLEKGAGACFYYQLKRCAGACTGKEAAEQYNARLIGAFDDRRLAEWPYRSPVLIEETNGQSTGAIIVDQWCVLASLTQENDNSPKVEFQEKMFDLDTYKILRSYMSSKLQSLRIKPISYREIDAMAA